MQTIAVSANRGQNVHLTTAAKNKPCMP